jgi:2-O-(6-phospho-alpha-D-mannosyl)-D-glycerate hydrolase
MVSVSMLEVQPIAEDVVPPGPWRLSVVPHTHWDREWYMPLEAFRIRLAHTIDEVLDVLEDDPRMRFTLDGQAVVLEDYAAHRPDPEHLRRLRALLESGRLQAGPLYTQPDEFLVGGEALVRNMLVGAAVCRRFGAEPAPIGYAPDAFGHVSQMPQILRGFGLDHFIFMRGLGDEAGATGAVMWWQGPDGSRVLAIPLGFGYGSAASVGMEDLRGAQVADAALWPDAAAERVGGLLAEHGPAHLRNGLRDMVLCNGVDHRRIQRNLAEMLAACAERLPGTEYRICHFDDYVATLRDQLPALRLGTMTGELLSGRFHTVTRGVNSSRLELKQRNLEVEQLLQSSETLAALAWLRDDYDYPAEAFEVAWRHLLRAQPHDSIAGCSVDQVHRDMRQRFDAAHVIAERIGQEALAAMSGDGRDAVWHWAGAPGARRTIVNVLPWPRRRPAALTIPAELRRARSLVARSDRGDLPVQLVGRDGGRRALVVADLPALGGLPLELRPGRAGVPEGAGARVAGPRTIENELLRVSVGDDGTLTLTDRATGRRWTGLHRFEDEADRGDSYTFCPLEGDAPRTSAGARATVRATASGPLRAELEVRLVLILPRALSADRRRRVGRVACPIVTRVRLHAGVDRVDLETRFVNRARDHRLRVRFPDRTARGGGVRAQSAFAVVERAGRPTWNARWYEQPARTAHTAGLVRAGELCLMTRGLPEYEAIPRPRGRTDLTLTLLRAIGWLSRADLATRPYGAGPEVEVPEAQGLGERTCEYALALRRDAGDAALVRATEDYRLEPADGPGRIVLDGILDVRGEGFAAGALKAAEDRDGVVLRLYNPGREPGFAEIAGAVAAVERCRLDETGGEPAAGRVELGPGEILTLRIRPAHGPAAPGGPSQRLPC